MFYIILNVSIMYYEIYRKIKFEVPPEHGLELFVRVKNLIILSSKKSKR